LNLKEKEHVIKKVVRNIEQQTKHAARATHVERQVEKKGARGGEAQRADAAARHQGRSTCGGQTIGVKYRGFICTFPFLTGGLSIFFMIPRVYLMLP